MTRCTVAKVHVTAHLFNLISQTQTPGERVQYITSQKCYNTNAKQDDYLFPNKVAIQLASTKCKNDEYNRGRQKDNKHEDKS